MNESRIETRDGLALACWHTRASAPRARIVLVHGYGEYAERYQPLAAELLAAGYELHLFDLRGHGGSEGERGHVTDVESYRDDLSRFAAHALRGEGAGGGATPAVLLGHSLGGLIALSTVLHERHPFAALIASSPFLRPGFSVSAVKEMALKVGAKLLPKLSIDADLDASGLSRDDAVVAAYVEDPKIVRTVTLGWGAAVLEAQEEVFERASDITVPTLFLLGGADPVADVGRNRAVFARLGSPDKTLRVYDGYRHEVLNELGRERVVADLLRWLDERFTPPGHPPPDLPPAGPPPAR